MHFSSATIGAGESGSSTRRRSTFLVLWPATLNEDGGVHVRWSL